MNYNVLRYFSVLAQVEHYTIAAARLGISQPSLSSAIHHLESELGDVQLFEKVGRPGSLAFEYGIDGACASGKFSSGKGLGEVYRLSHQSVK